MSKNKYDGKQSKQQTKKKGKKEAFSKQMENAKQAALEEEIEKSLEKFDDNLEPDLTEKTLQEQKLVVETLKAEVEYKAEEKRLEMIGIISEKMLMMLENITEKKAQRDANKWIVEGVGGLVKTLKLLQGEPTEIRKSITSPSEMTDEELIKREEQLNSLINEKEQKMLEATNAEVIDITPKEEPSVVRTETVYKKRTIK
jgi:hypothetical protein